MVNSKTDSLQNAVTIEQIKKWYSQFNNDIFLGVLPEDMEIKLNGRLKDTKGRCHYGTTGKFHDKSNDLTIFTNPCSCVHIDIAKNIISSEEAVKSVLLHEMCHAYQNIWMRCNDGHGPIWQSIAKMASEKSGIPVTKYYSSTDFNGAGERKKTVSDKFVKKPVIAVIIYDNIDDRTFAKLIHPHHKEAALHDATMIDMRQRYDVEVYRGYSTIVNRLGYTKIYRKMPVNKIYEMKHYASDLDDIKNNFERIEL